MLDINTIFTNEEALRNRGVSNETLRTLKMVRTEQLDRMALLQERKTRKNVINKLIANGVGDRAPLVDESKALGQEIAELERNVGLMTEAVRTLILDIPNLPLVDVHDGIEPKIIQTTPPGGEGVPHYDITKEMDFERATKIAGSRFVVLRGDLARLERVVGDYMLNSHTAAGWEEVAPPTLVNANAMTGTGQLPKFHDDAYETAGLFLVPTSEVSLTNLYRDEIIDLTGEPIRMTARTSCFRKEAGSAGRDTRGMIRQHEFKKVELVAICRPEDAEAIHQEMLVRARQVLIDFGLPHRTALLGAGDMGFSARKTYDLEVWLPGQNAWREISSISNCGDFQARRMACRYRENGKTAFPYTLNGSGLAIGRTIVAILENGFRNGVVKLPECLWVPFGAAELVVK